MERPTCIQHFIFFLAAMEECPVCLELFGLDNHIPKSLDCRHAVCTECVMNPGLQNCPVCRGAIINGSTVPNDLSIIAYLEKNKREKYLKEQRGKVKNMIEQVIEASEDINARLKEEKVSAAQIVEERSAVFNSYMSYLFQKCQQRCDSKPFLPDAAMTTRKELENTLHDLEMSIVACTSLLDNPDVIADEIDRCESEVLNVVKKCKDSLKSGVSEETMWDDYRQLMMETFGEISKQSPTCNYNFTERIQKDSDEDVPPLMEAKRPRIAPKRRVTNLLVLVVILSYHQIGSFTRAMHYQQR